MKSLNSIVQTTDTVYAITDSGNDTFLITSRRESPRLFVHTAYVFWDGEIVLEPVSGWKVNGGRQKSSLDLVVYCLAHAHLDIYGLRDQTIDYASYENLMLDDSRMRYVYRTWASGQKSPS